MRALLFCLSLMLSSLAVAADAARALPWEGKGADGHAIRFDPDHLERPAVLLFWATWCPYCKALMPHVQAVYDAAGKAKLDVYAIDIQDDGDPVAELRERGQTFTLVRDGDPIARQYGIKGTPGLLLVDRSGAIVYRRVGGDAPETVAAALREHLGLPTAPQGGITSAPRESPSSPSSR
ncbi:MAG: TlpA family protein disulfide reductase [Dokdonella sp.]|uniref:TlpA family protein disulfide reductase n=1 Tax=Dokdonella sp. TaxID=2291710 RepID=UPI003F8099A4